MTAPLWSSIDQACIRSNRRNWTEMPRRHAYVVVEHSRFICRCAVAGSLAYIVADYIGLHHAVWAPISALAVSQENITATLSSAGGRFVGTLLGAVVALFVHWLGELVNAPLVLQIAAAVAICATYAVGRPALRVCLWTCPLVLVTAPSAGGPDIIAVLRSSEVILGAIVGGFVHLGEAQTTNLLKRLIVSVPSPPTVTPDEPPEPPVKTTSSVHSP
jgi:uncharacterized membrane protein YccC